MEKLNKNIKAESPVFILLGLASKKLVFQRFVFVSQIPAISSLTADPFLLVFSPESSLAHCMPGLGHGTSPKEEDQNHEAGPTPLRLTGVKTVTIAYCH